MPLSDDDAAAIQREQNALKRDLEAIRNNPRLTDAGKKVEIAAAYKRARDVTRSVRDRVSAEDARKRANLEPVLFGAGSQPNGSEVLAYRDAMDRAMACRSADDLARLLDGARLTGDRLLQKAAFTVAWQKADDTIGRGYVGIVEGVLAADDTTRRLAETYLAHTEQPRGVFPDISRPSELHGADVDQLANNVGDAAATA